MKIVGKEYLNDKDYNVALEKIFYPVNFTGEENFSTLSVYDFSNEDLEEQFIGKDLKGKSVAVVGSSGDQMLSALFRGASDITLVDANVLAEYYIEYKFAMIKTFSFKEFMSLAEGKNKFNWRIYSKISRFISSKAKNFWDTIFLTYDETQIYASMINSLNYACLFNDRYYKDEKSYNLIKEKLKTANINFVVSDISDFPKDLEKKYDLITLSNIVVFEFNQKKYFKTVLKLYEKNLKPDGKIMFAYEFDDLGTSFPKSYLKILKKCGLEIVKTKRDHLLFFLSKGERTKEKDVKKNKDKNLSIKNYNQDYNEINL